jgi:sulfite reductase (NADPH) hemoprotein beta-component
MSTETAATPKSLSANEGIKEASNFLRGTIAQELLDTSTGAISEDNGQLTKFHGLYLQDDRDLRKERTKLKQEKAYGFMLRVRLPGGQCTPQQWLMLDDIADKLANHSLRLTTRQTFQFHGVLKGNLRPLIKQLDKVLLDSIAACGDVNRNVMAAPNPERSPVHQQVYGHARTPEPTTKSGSTTNSSLAANRTWNRSTVRRTCRANLKSASPFRRRTTSTYFHRTSVSSP